MVVEAMEADRKVAVERMAVVMVVEAMVEVEQVEVI